MKRLFRAYVVGACIFSVAWPSAAQKRAPANRRQELLPDISTCAEVSGSVRVEAYGFTHVVTLTNRCTVSVECDVWTDVDPEPRVTLRAGPGASAEVVTRRGSPAREVTAQKICRRV